MDLDKIQKTVRAQLDATSEAREIALPICRDVVRTCANTIRAVHRGERDDAERLMKKAAEGLETARSALQDHPEILHAGFFHDAAKEYAEARLTHALVFELDFPTPEDVGVAAPAYLNGMGEAVGEMRRHILDLMRHGELKRSDALLDAMDEIYYLLISIDYPDAVTSGLRRTTDVTRSILERTRGDLSTTIVQHELKAALEQAQKEISSNS